MCRAADEPLISPTLWRNIIGQAVFQLAVMYALVTSGDAIFGVPSHAAADGPSVHYTLVFNAFVLMQLFNQVPYSCNLCLVSVWICVESILEVQLLRRGT